jgi:taurine dioxygenase
MDATTVGDIRAALLEHKVVWFRGQTLDGASLTAVATQFGTPTEAHPVEPALEGHPEVLPLDSEEGARADVWHSDLTFQPCPPLGAMLHALEGHPEVLPLDSEEGARADVWHSDLTFQPCPPLGAMLHALEIPSVGGDTIWADMTRAYRSLSGPLRGFVDGLSATHSPTKAGDYFAGRDRTGGEAADRTAVTSIRHPVVRTHPETGERSLFVNPLFTDKVDGLRRHESDVLLGLLYEAAAAPEGLVRWKWEAGDVAFWDNRCTMHYALLDFGTDRRRMLRVALEGDSPVGVSTS